MKSQLQLVVVVQKSTNKARGETGVLLTLSALLNMVSPQVGNSGKKCKTVAGKTVLVEIKKMLSGSHPARLDEKDRVTIASKLMKDLRENEGLGEGDDVKVVVTIVKRRLGVFPKRVFDELMAKLSALPEKDPGHDFKAVLMNYMDEQSLDKLNRFRVPSMYAQLLNLVDDVVVMGSGSHLEVVNRGDWLQQAAEQMATMPKVSYYLN